MVSTLEQWLFLSGPESGGDTLRNSCKGCATELSKFPRGALPYKSDRDAHREIQIKPRGTNVDVAQA